MHRTSIITLTTLSLALAISVPASAKKKTKTDDEAAKADDSKKVEAKADAPTSELWFEAPIVAAPAKSDSKKAKATTKKAEKAEKPRYGLGLGLRNARNKRAAPKVEEHAEDMSRKLSQNDVRRVLRQHQYAISFCGRRAAKKGEKQTQVLLKFEVDSKGSARGIAVTDVRGKALPAMSKCMKRSSRNWKFPADTAGGNIEYPLMLNRR